MLALVPGQPDNSLWIDALNCRSLQMPPADKGGKLPDEEIVILTKCHRDTSLNRLWLRLLGLGFLSSALCSFLESDLHFLFAPRKKLLFESIALVEISNA